MAKSQGLAPEKKMNVVLKYNCSYFFREQVPFVKCRLFMINQTVTL